MWVEGLLIKDVQSNFRIQYDPTTFSVIINLKSIGQFTGLFDKNGVKIFTGDIINNGLVSFIIEFDKFMFCAKKIPKRNFYSLVSFERSIANYSIIGNIIDNPELV